MTGAYRPEPIAATPRKANSPATEPASPALQRESSRQSRGEPVAKRHCNPLGVVGWLVFFKQDGSEIAKAKSRLDSLERELRDLYSRWEKLEARM